MATFNKIQEIIREANMFAQFEQINENARTPEVVTDLRQQLRGICDGAADQEQAVGQILQLITDYYDHTHWSLEKEEWDKLTPEQQSQFAEVVYNVVSR